ncbi:MAG: alanine racemase [Clostridia bacterium]|nr:alanine racemase [Clostridia bacterium]
MLGYTPTAYARELFTLGITQTLLSWEYAEALASGTYPVLCHLAVDTGMRRIGVMPDIKECKELLSRYRNKLEINGIFTHLAAADGTSDEDKAFTKRQAESFVSLLDGLGGYTLSAHCLNSAGVLYHKDEVDSRLRSLSRVGIALYGLSPRCDGLVTSPLSPALGWKTVIAALRAVNRGESIGYGRSYVAERDMLIATLPVGYADGYPRELSSRGMTLTRGHRASVVGRVCMNQMMIDVSGVPGVKLWDEVTLIGKDGNEKISVDTLAELSGKISYDILTGISEHIPRIYK